MDQIFFREKNQTFHAIYDIKNAILCHISHEIEKNLTNFKNETFNS